MVGSRVWRKGHCPTPQALLIYGCSLWLHLIAKLSIIILSINIILLDASANTDCITLLLWLISAYTIEIKQKYMQKSDMFQDPCDQR